MKFGKLAIIAFIFPPLLSVLLLFLNFSLNTKETLGLFLPLVWGIFVALCGSFVFIQKTNYDKQKRFGDYIKAISLKINGVSLILILHSLIFDIN